MSHNVVLAIDLVLLTVIDNQLHVVMGEATERPYSGELILPGMVMRQEQNLNIAAEEYLHEQIGTLPVELRQFGTFGDPGRYPGGSWLVSVGYLGLMPAYCLEHVAGPMMDYRLIRVECGPFAIDAGLFYEGEQLVAVMDQAHMIGRAVKQLRAQIHSTMDIFKLVPNPFTILDLMNAHEAVLCEKLVKPYFRRQILERIFPDGTSLVPTEHKRLDGAHRPATLYNLGFAKKRPE